MCRLYGFRANEATKVECSLVHAQNALLLQSRSDMIGRSHADGWGLAYYQEGTLVVEHRESAAFEDLQFSETAERIYAETVVAHVRRATVGGASKVNTHPFRHGRWVFAHNGTVAAFDALGPELARETSVELQRHRRRDDRQRAGLFLAPDAHVAPGDRPRGRSARRATARRRRRGGDRVARRELREASGKRRGFEAQLPHHQRGGPRREPPQELSSPPHPRGSPGLRDLRHPPRASRHERRYHAVAVASEPITHETWHEVPDAHVVAVDRALRVDTQAIC